MFLCYITSRKQIRSPSRLLCDTNVYSLQQQIKGTLSPKSNLMNQWQEYGWGVPYKRIDDSKTSLKAPSYPVWGLLMNPGALRDSRQLISWRGLLSAQSSWGKTDLQISQPSGISWDLWIVYFSSLSGCLFRISLVLGGLGVFCCCCLVGWFFKKGFLVK